MECLTWKVHTHGNTTYKYVRNPREERRKIACSRGSRFVEKRATKTFDVNVLRNRSTRRGRGRRERQRGPEMAATSRIKRNVFVQSSKARWIGTRCNVCERIAEKESEKKPWLNEWNGAGRWTRGLRGAVKKMATKKANRTRVRPREEDERYVGDPAFRSAKCTCVIPREVCWIVHSFYLSRPE